MKFGNPGSIDPRMWNTFGVSAKNSDGAIGKFGTGLKYAIAVLLREGREISIETDGELYTFTTEDADFRGKSFKQCMCNGNPLPFTTHLGAEWELWMAYREIASNCLDEGGKIGESGETTITADFRGVNHSDVFLNTQYAPAFSSPDVDIYYGESDVVYYRGVRVYAPQRRCCTTINIKNASITEDRTLAHEWQVREAVAEAVLSDNIPQQLLEHLMLHSKDKYEEAAWFEYRKTIPNKRLVEAVHMYRKKGIYVMPGLERYVLSKEPPKSPEIVEPDSRQEVIIQRACAFLDRIGYPVKYSVSVSHDLGNGVLGMADMKTERIYLSARVLTQGLKQVASTLLEENIHLSEGLRDNTYEMQSYLFDQIVTMGERLANEIL